MRKYAIGIVTMLAITLSSCGADTGSDSDEDALVVGIAEVSTTASNSDTITGFKAAMEEQFPDRDIEYLAKNAQGDLAVLDLLARQLVREEPDFIYALGTPVIVSLTKVAGDIPIVFGLMFDPVGAGVVESLDKPGGVATGTSVNIPAEDYVEASQVLLKDVSTIGFIGNPSEDNTAASIEQFESAVAGGQKGMELLVAPITTTGDVVLAVRSLAGRVDVLIVTGDNTAISAIETVAQTALQEKIPLIGITQATVDKGGLAGLGAKWAELGAIGAEQAKSIIVDGKSPGDIPVWSLADHPDSYDIVVSSDTAAALDINLDSLDLPETWRVQE